MLDIQENPYQGNKAKNNKVYHLTSNKGYDEDIKRDRVGIFSGVPSSYMNENGDLVSWVISKKITTSGVEKKILGKIAFMNGKLEVGSHQKDLMEFLDNAPWNKANKVKFPKKKTLFEEHDPGAEKEANYETVTHTVDVYNTILSLEGSALENIARGFGVKVDQDEKHIQIDLISKAKNDPVQFEAFMNSNEIKIKVLISKAKEMRLIECQKNIWQWRSKSTGNYNIICSMPKSVRDPINYLADHLTSPDGAEVREVLLNSTSISNEEENIEEPENESEPATPEYVFSEEANDGGFSS